MKHLTVFVVLSPCTWFISDSLPLEDAWSQVLRIAEARLRNVLLPVSAWGVLSKRLYESFPYLENLRVTPDGNGYLREQPSATITRPLRQRLYGILLHEIKHLEPTVTEWCGENRESYKNPVTVQPEYIQGNNYDLIAMMQSWSTSFSYIGLSRPTCQNAWKKFGLRIIQGVANVVQP